MLTSTWQTANKLTVDKQLATNVVSQNVTTPSVTSVWNEHDLSYVLGFKLFIFSLFSYKIIYWNNKIEVVCSADSVQIQIRNIKRLVSCLYGKQVTFRA